MQAATALLSAALLVALACGERPLATAPSAPTTTASVATASAPASAPSSAPIAAEPDAGAQASLDAGPPPKVERTGKVWPFHAWTRAEAITFNEFRARPNVPLVVVSERGWSPYMAARKPVTMTQAKRAVDLVIETEGSVDVSKCAFPRHAVVLFENDVPVASVNVCFECGDIRVWPPFTPERDWNELTEKERAADSKRQARQLKLYDRAFPKWKTFFRDDLGFAIDAKY